MTRHRQTLLLLTLALVACAERQADDDASDEPEAEPTCMILPASGHWEDGSSRTIQNEWGTVGTVCMCLTEGERMSDDVRQELNDMAHVECERISTLVWDFDWTECQELYESGAWLNGVFIARDDTEWMNHGRRCRSSRLGGRTEGSGHIKIASGVRASSESQFPSQHAPQ